MQIIYEQIVHLVDHIDRIDHIDHIDRIDNVDHIDHIDHLQCTVMYTLKSISIGLIRSHNLEHTKYLT